MKINEILTEAPIKQYNRNTLSVAEAIDFIKKNCSDALRAFRNKPLYRGSNSLDEAKCYYIDPASGTRKSQNTFNHYTMIMDESPYFKGYPKRSNSLICTTDMNYAFTFGDSVFGVYPVNGTKIGICPDFDIWETKLPSNKYKLQVWEDIPSFLDSFDIDADTIKNMQAQVESNPEISQKINDYAKLRGFSDITPNNLISDVVNIMRPDLCGFELIDTNTALPKEEREAWFSGPCIAVSTEVIREMFK